MKGDRVEIVIDAGGDTRSYEVVATRAGRRVEVTTGRGIVEVSEVTRGGTVVRTARFMASRVLALVEHPAPRPRLPDDATTRDHSTVTPGKDPTDDG
jgi:Mg-chelatase subunit ChlI